MSDVDKTIDIPGFLTDGTEASDGTISVGEDGTIEIPAFLADVCGGYEIDPAAICTTVIERCTSATQGCTPTNQRPCIPANQGCGTDEACGFTQTCTACEVITQSCTSTCEVSCQSCQGAATCQSCEGSSCQTCQSCQGCQTSCETTSQAPTTYGSMSVTNITATTITVSYSSIPNATRYYLFIRLASETSFNTVTTSGLSYTFTGLQPSTQYAFNYHGIGSDGSEGPNMPSAVYGTTLPGADPWSWTSSNGTATALQTQTAYSVCQGTATADQFNHLVWNDLVDKVVEALGIKSKSWTTTGGITQAGCKVSAGEALSAAKYNALRANVDALGATGIGSVSRDSQEMTGYHIVHLTDVLNASIGG